MGFKFYGVYAFPVTPFDTAGAVDEAVLRRHLRFLLTEGRVHGVIPTGSTGEMAFLSDAERKQVVDITLEEVNGKVPVFVGAAACSTSKTIENALYAQRAGAQGVMIVAPFYGHLDQEELYRHYASVADCIDIPIMAYNNPSTSGSDTLPSTLARLAETGRVVAVKESTGQMQRVSEIMRLCGDKLQVLCGCDTLPMEMFAVGVKAWVAAPSNIIPAQCVELFELMVEKPNVSRARELYFRLLPLFSVLEESGQYVQLIKAGLALRGMPVGAPRPPLLPIDPEQVEQVRSILANILVWAPA